MNFLRVAVLFFVFAAASRAGETNTLPTKITIDGVTYEDVRWGTVTRSAVSMFHKTGIATIPLEKLPPDLQKQFGYDPKKAALHRTAESQADEINRQADAERVRKANEQQEREQGEPNLRKNAVWIG